MDIFRGNINNIDLDSEDDPDTINLIKLLAWHSKKIQNFV